MSFYRINRQRRQMLDRRLGWPRWHIPRRVESRILDRKEAELTQMLRNWNGIAIEKNPDQINEIQYRRNEIWRLETWTVSPTCYVTRPPAEVISILMRACRDCHSNETIWPVYSKFPGWSLRTPRKGKLTLTSRSGAASGQRWLGHACV